ncbi:sulfatase-like hydrolase/transferase [Parapusillimonas sp. JC17]|uniref:sulfatase-like hydrolase/transferase n=1 Tax=Parapusillimonas sp. JC17 TaxID=3445768 RepID=UPI003F9F8E8E
MKKTLPTMALAAVAALGLTSCGSDSNVASSDPAPSNILFVIMDDVGIDQMRSFGYGGATPPSMPNMDAIARVGVRFRNTWSMPECSPGRAAFFAGRYPFRTNVNQALGPSDLANSQLSPYDMTTPKLLKEAGYESGLFGKFHLAGPENNQAGAATPSVAGWDYFYGWVGGLPGSVDTTAGGVGAEKTYSCGFVPGTQAGGADTGACYQADNTCSVVTRSALVQDAAGLQCLASGGIFVPNELCGKPPSTLNFSRVNGYYVSPLVIINGDSVEEVPLADPRARKYRTQLEADAAINWIKSRPANKPWMATVSFTAAHTPWQQPPGELLSMRNDPVSDNWNCNGPEAGRLIQDKMTEAMDTEFGRLLVETGLASRADDGSLVYDPKTSGTTIVIIGDNGTLGTAVKQPFIPSQAKGTSYQTGVWDPLIIAGPQVVQPDRNVEHMVNAVDLFQFFAEIAGLDAHKTVPRTIDSVGLLPYLANPEQASLRTINFTMGGGNLQAHGARNGPCVISGSCTQSAPSKEVCQDNQGNWWGADYTHDSVIPNNGVGYETCADVNHALYNEGREMFNVLPDVTMAVRNDRYKLVRNIVLDFNPAVNEIQTNTIDELYEVDQATPKPLLDTPDRNLLASPTTETQAIYDNLHATLDRILASEPDCPGDGNKDGVVDAKDLENWRQIAFQWGLSSVYDFVVGGVYDGLTNHLDEAVIQSNLNKTCKRSYGVY